MTVSVAPSFTITMTHCDSNYDFQRDFKRDRDCDYHVGSDYGSGHARSRHCGNMCYLQNIPHSAVTVVVSLTITMAVCDSNCDFESDFNCDCDHDCHIGSDCGSACGSGNDGCYNMCGFKDTMALGIVSGNLKNARAYPTYDRVAKLQSPNPPLICMRYTQTRKNTCTLHHTPRCTQTHSEGNKKRPITNANTTLHGHTHAHPCIHTQQPSDQRIQPHTTPTSTQRPIQGHTTTDTHTHRHTHRHREEIKGTAKAHRHTHHIHTLAPLPNHKLTPYGYWHTHTHIYRTYNGNRKQE